MDGQLPLVAVAVEVGVGTVGQERLHAGQVALLSRDEQRRGQVCGLAVHIGTWTRSDRHGSGETHMTCVHIGGSRCSVLIDIHQVIHAYSDINNYTGGRKVHWNTPIVTVL